MPSLCTTTRTRTRSRPSVLLLLAAILSSSLCTSDRITFFAFAEEEEGAADAGPCTPCPYPDDSYDMPAAADRALTIPGLGTVTCGFVDSTLSNVLQASQPQCAAVQAMGTHCGCPVRPDACTTTTSATSTSSSPLSSSSTTTSSSSSSWCDSFDPTATVTNFRDTGDDVTCDLVRAYLQSLSRDDQACRQGLEDWAATCGCGVVKDGGRQENNHTNSNNNNIAIGGASSASNNETIPALQPPGESNGEGGSCKTSLCLHGGTPGFADKDMTQFYRVSQGSNDLITSIGARINVTNVTCAVADRIMQSGLLPAAFCGSDEHVFFAGSCGCPALPSGHDVCVFCPTNDISRPDDMFTLSEIVYGLPATCRETELRLTQTTATDARCWAAKHLSYACGCNQGVPWYLGADSERQHVVLAWMPRLSGTLSLAGSLYIVQDIWRQYGCPNHQRRQGCHHGNSRTWSTYHVILLGMSCFDILGSLAWMVSTAALPAYDKERQVDSGVYGAVGNDLTCKVQGFFLELGFIGSTAFNASLTTFYLLAIVYGYRETKTKAWRKYLVAIPSIVAVVLASAAIPYYRPFYVACLVSNPNSEVSRYADEWIYLIVFSILPVGLAIVWSVGNMAAICRHVWNTNRKADRWNFRAAPEEAARTPTSEFFPDPPPSSLRGSMVRDNSQRSSFRFSVRQQNASNDGQQEQQQGQQPQRLKRQRRRRHKSETAVFWQAFLYVVAFLLTWVIYIVSQVKPYFSSNDEGLYAFWIVMLILNPLMGFWNAFVYVKPWTWTWKRNVTRRSSSSGISPGTPPANTSDDPKIPTSVHNHVDFRHSRRAISSVTMRSDFVPTESATPLHEEEEEEEEAIVEGQEENHDESSQESADGMLNPNNLTNKPAVDASSSLSDESQRVIAQQI